MEETRQAAATPRRHVVLALLLSLSAIACGKVGPPQPPITRTPSRPNQLAAVQVGAVVRLTWSAPALDLRENEPAAVQRADIFRLRQLRTEPPATIGDELEEAADVIGFLDHETLKQQLKADGRILFEDRLDLTQSAVLTNTRLQYAVRFVDGRGRPLPFSNIVSIEPVPGIARPPSDLTATEQQDQVTLAWSPPTENIDGTVPAQVLGYNVYRAKPNAPSLGRPINDRPIEEAQFVDRNFLYLTPYVYVVRSVSQGPDATVESSDSERLEVTPRDTFRPAAPTSVTVASAGSIISLFWPTNVEQDVVGYFVYRAESAETPDWQRITDKPVTRATFRDERVRAGTRYLYRVTAVDRYGNESEPSAVVSEIANP